MSKENSAIDLDSLKMILQDHLDIESQAKILKDIEQALKDDQEAEGEGEPTEAPLPKPKKKMVVIITALPQDNTAKGLSECPAFVGEILEETSTREIADMIKEVSGTYKETNKARKNPLKTVGELWTSLGPKYFKAVGLGKKSKEVVEVVFLDNNSI